jgi:small nuclear ribonucleoprotein (snRNP)-like protein
MGTHTHTRADLVAAMPMFASCDPADAPNEVNARQKIFVFFAWLCPWVLSCRPSIYFRPSPFHSFLPQSDPEARAYLEKLCGARLRVTIVDGRVFTGELHCVDPQGNIVLESSMETRPTPPGTTDPETHERPTGMILIPHFQQVSIARSKGHETHIL